MKIKYPALFFILLITCRALAQQELPVVKSNTMDVFIQHDGMVTNWHLEPATRPDIYSIANNLQNHTVSVITDIDSASFVVQPGAGINFIILYRETQSCYTRITVLNNPFFFRPAGYLSLVILLLLLFSFFVVKRKSLSTLFLLKFGWISALLFWIMTAIGGLLHNNYSHARMGVSELGSIGTNSEVFMALLTMLLAVLTLLFSIGFIKASRRLRILSLPAWLSIGMSISMAWSAIFPSGNIWHGLLGPLPLTILLGALLAAVFWNQGPAFSRIRKLSLLSLFIMLLFVLRFMPYLQQSFEGLIQRSLWLGWAVWYVSLSIELSQLIRSKKPEQG